VNYTRKTVILIAIAVLIAIGLTIEGTYLILNKWVLASDDPLYRSGGLSPQQDISQHR
jgi:hypothetical protein